MQSIFLLVTLASAALAAPQSYNRPGVGGNQGNFRIVPILRDDRNGPVNGVYDFNFETGDGIRRNEQGAPTGPNGAVVQQGGWTMTFPDGTTGQFSFIADEFGYRVESPLLPTPPPMPAHALEQIQRAERERAQGIVHDGQYDPSRYGGGQPVSQQFRGGRRNYQ
ncbi:Insect cuticle protein [Trinorchestia longiramus]|nr:Insect cuticle protein [Trinorchestia longiramus]